MFLGAKSLSTGSDVLVTNKFRYFSSVFICCYISTINHKKDVTIHDVIISMIKMINIYYHSDGGHG
jgi:hypothetical protein